MTREKILYLSYDGLLDPLGRSQIFNYFRHFPVKYNLLFLTFEKSRQSIAEQQVIKEQFNSQGFHWLSLKFHAGGMTSKIVDSATLFFSVLRLCARREVEFVHCRGHVPAFCCFPIFALFGIPYIFDFRGFWIDEKIEKEGVLKIGWGLRTVLWCLRRYEKAILARAKQVVVLTDAAKERLRIDHGLSGDPVVIPCCADFTVFSVVPKRRVKRFRCDFNIPLGSYIVGYLGSVGRMYDMDSWIRFVQYANERTSVFALIISPNKERAEECIRLLNRDGIRGLALALYGEQLALAVGSVDLMVAFNSITIARDGTSLTKLGESLACGVPFVGSKGIGDSELILRSTGGGCVINQADVAEFERAWEEKEGFTSGQTLRSNAETWLSVKLGVERYIEVYERMRF